MSKTKVSKEEFLEELNRTLKDHPGYEGWMQFVPAPRGVEPDVFVGAEQDGGKTPHSLYELIAMKVGELFEVFPK